MGICETEGNDQRPEEVSIWLGIIKIHAEEASKGNLNAMAWIFSKEHEEEFEEICNLADVDIGWIRRKLLERFAREKQGKNTGKRQKKKIRGRIKTGDGYGKS